VFIPGQSHPVNVPRGSEALYMLQRIRDEAHRFANSFHRELRDKRMKESVLDGIAGLGESRRQRLLKELGTLKAVKEAPLEQLQALPWLPDAVALAIFHKIHGDGSETPT
jgi:excinuclease ABC subunit C